MPYTQRLSILISFLECSIRTLSSQAALWDLLPRGYFPDHCEILLMSGNRSGSASWLGVEEDGMAMVTW